MEISKKESCYIIKPNPCFDKIPYEVYESLINRMSNEELKLFLSSLFGRELDLETMPLVLEKSLQYIKKRLDCTYKSKRIDVYCNNGMKMFIETGKITDHLQYLPAFNKEEVLKTLEYIQNRNDNPNDDYKFYITENELVHKDLVVVVSKDFGITIEYIFPNQTEGLWKLSVMQSKRLASIFCDYIENHIPLNLVMTKNKSDDFIQSLIKML